MAGKLQKKTSQFIVTVFVFTIVIAFIISGMQTGAGRANSVGAVGDKEISIGEFRQVFNRMISTFQRGDFRLTQKQIEQFGLRERAFDQLVSQKLYLVLAEELGIAPSDEEVAETIKKQSYFLTNKQFDINRYKQLLSANGLTPSGYEDITRDQLKAQNLGATLGVVPLSSDYVKAIKESSDNRIKVSYITFSDDEMKNNLTVSKSEVKAYLANKENKEKVEKKFLAKKPTLDKPEQVRASHILLKTTKDNEAEVLKKMATIKKSLTTKNFAKVANKHTEDASGKNKGGALGTFGRGKMVPEFEKVAFSLKPGQISNPVKTPFGYHIIYVQDKIPAVSASLSKYENEIAKEMIRDSKAAELDQFIKTKVADFSNTLEKGNQKAIDKIRRDYGVSVNTTAELSYSNNRVGSKEVSYDKLQELFFKGKKILNYKDGNQNIIIVNKGKVDVKAPKDADKELENEIRNQTYQFNNKVTTAFFETLKKKVKVSNNLDRVR